MTALACAGPPASVLLEARLEGRSLPAFPAPVPTTLADAYACQKSLCAALASPVQGWKVGLIPEPFVEKLETERLAGPVLRCVAMEGAAGTAHIFEEGAGAIEAEIMFRLDSVPGRLPRTEGEVRALVGDIRAGFEVASSPAADVHAHAPFGIIADLGINNGILLGPRLEADRFEHIAVETRIEGQLVGKGYASAILDGPWGALRFLLGLHFDGTILLAPGQWISAGAITGVHPIGIGQRAIATYGSDIVLECIAAAETGYAR